MNRDLVRPRVSVSLAAGVLAAAVVGCGGDAAHRQNVTVVHPPWTELGAAALNVTGGSAASAGGVGAAGGAVHLVARGNVSIDSASSSSAGVQVPAAPAGATKVATDALAADVSVAGDVRVTGDTASGGADAMRTITSEGGDVFVDGVVRGADLGGARQAIAVSATGGTVYVTGTIDTSGSTDQAGGAIRITARRIVITGKLLAAGGDSPAAGGAAGAISMVASETVTISGVIETFGGNAVGGAAVTGGAAASLVIQAGGDVAVGGTTLARGGAATTTASADAHGGAAGELRIDADGAVRLAGTFDARGGLAKAAGGAVLGGAAGSVHVGEAAAPSDIGLLAPIVAAGGDGDSAGGQGGTVTPEPDTGDVIIAGTKAIDVGGGASRVAGGAGGTVTGGPRRDPGSSGVHIAGEIIATGGACKPGGVCAGGAGGRVDFHLVPTAGVAVVEESGKITVDGGSAAGAAVAGGGGHVWMVTKDGDLTMAGAISARGGDAPDAGGTGGLGGMVYFFTDDNHNAIDVQAGNLLVDTTGVVDASGGKGAGKGGDARSDGRAGYVPAFPEFMEQIAIFLNCDGAHGETLNWMENRGHLIARGGAANGNGGDIVYHGVGPGQRGTPLEPDQTQHHPPSGAIDLSGAGSGQPGDYGGE